MSVNDPRVYVTPNVRENPPSPPAPPPPTQRDLVKASLLVRACRRPSGVLHGTL
jgi:hypothetical protein